MSSNGDEETLECEGQTPIYDTQQLGSLPLVGNVVEPGTGRVLCKVVFLPIPGTSKYVITGIGLN